MIAESIATGIAASSIWDGFKKFASKVKNNTDWSKFNLDQAEKDYRNNIKTMHGKLRILDKISATRRFDLQRLLEDDSMLRNVERRNGLEVVKKFENSRLFILGKPGAGKTTF